MSVNMATSEFDLKYLADSLEKCKQEDGAISMDDYLDAYDQISKFLQLLGSIFTFVVSDVNEKIQILRQYRLGTDADHYVTVDRMMAYEIQQQLTKKTSKPSGSRTLLRLHRAFEFVMDFIREMRNAKEDTRMSELTRTSYDRTLAKFHPWLVRQGVYLAAYTLPRISQLSVKMKSKDNADSHMDRVLQFSKPIYDKVQDLYIKNELNNLP